MVQTKELMALIQVSVRKRGLLGKTTNVPITLPL